VTGIAVAGLSKSYRRGLAGERVRALQDVSLRIEPGEAFGIIGPNGAGKTTFLGCLLGFLRPDAGTITIDGRAPDDLEVRAATGYLPERLVMDRWMTGRDFLAYHHALARLPEASRDADVEAALDLVALDAEARARPIRRYSRGMLQRVGLAQALLGTPRFVFLDEPASGVDPAGVVLFRRIVASLKSRGATLVLNSHQLDQVERVCDRVAFVSHGRVESIETMTAGAGHARGVHVRWTGAAHAAETLGDAAGRAGAALVEAGASSARFSVADDASAALLVQALVAAGVAVFEVTPEESRLERLFVGGAARADAVATAPAAAADHARFQPPPSGSAS
jgi:ABC-2 type transport system ATP-binding protein